MKMAKKEKVTPPTVQSAKIHPYIIFVDSQIYKGRYFLQIDPTNIFWVKNLVTV